CAQAELLAAFSGGAPANAPALAGAFPNDQAVSITIDIAQTDFASGSTTQTAPDLDLTSITDKTFAMVGVLGDGTPQDQALDTLSLSYAKSSDHGTLTIRRLDGLPWPPGAYSVVLRGGPSGIKTAGAAPLPVYPSQVFD